MTAYRNWENLEVRTLHSDSHTAAHALEHPRFAVMDRSSYYMTTSPSMEEVNSRFGFAKFGNKETARTLSSLGADHLALDSVSKAIDLVWA